jgi:hypothetical protein
MTTKTKAYSCVACPGASCNCGCQSAKAKSQAAGCACGEHCKCGPTCSCRKLERGQDAAHSAGVRRILERKGATHAQLFQPVGPGREPLRT